MLNDRSFCMCSIGQGQPPPGSCPGVVLLHLISLYHHLTPVWRWASDGFARAGPRRPPCPSNEPELQMQSLSLFILYLLLILKNLSGGMKCVKFGGWKCALWGVEKCQFGGWKCVKFGGWKCAGMKWTTTFLSMVCVWTSKHHILYSSYIFFTFVSPHWGW